MVVSVVDNPISVPGFLTQEKEKKTRKIMKKNKLLYQEDSAPLETPRLAGLFGEGAVLPTPERLVQDASMAKYQGPMSQMGA